MLSIKDFLFLEVKPLIKKAKLRPLEMEDMLPLPSMIDPRNHYFDTKKLDWSDPNKLLWSTLILSRTEIIPAYIMYGLHVALSLVTPMLVHTFISLLSKVQNSDPSGLLFKKTIGVGLMLGLAGLLSGSFLQQYFFKSLKAYQIVTNILNEKIFGHSLKLTMAQRQKNMIGDVVNHMSSDSDSVGDFSFIFADIVSNILLIIGVVGMLFYYLGSTAFAVIAIVLLMIPATKWIAKKFTVIDEEMMQERDKRVMLMTQILNAIRIVKFYAWETSVEEEVMAVRNKELNMRRKLARSEVLTGLIYMASSSLILFLALGVHVYRGNHLDAALIFTCVSLLGLLDGPMGEMSHHISRLTNSFVGARRLIAFFKQQTNTHRQLIEDENETLGIEVKDINASYDKGQGDVLTNIHFKIDPGESMAIIGPFGAGKTTLLYALLDELNLSEGQISFFDRMGEHYEDKRPKIAFLPQEAYIINASLKENILFGEDHLNDEELYNEELNRALFLSALDHDIQLFSHGLDTEIGEKGVNLSGGQKQRVGLARAYLSHPQVVLLDDPLSAVDNTTEKILCDRLIFGEWKNKTRIVVTHRLDSLQHFDHIMMINDGKVSAFGSFNDLKKNSQHFNDFYADHFQPQTHTTDNKNDKSNFVNPNPESINQNDSSARITEDEDREKGAVNKSIYIDYINSLGGDNNKTRLFILTLLFSGAVIVALAPLIQKYWLTYLSAHMSNHQFKWGGLAGIGIYGLIGLLILILGLMNNLFWLDRGIKAGKLLHDKMLKSVLNSPVRFFDSTPIGRIIQRFSRDVESVDVYLQWSFVSVVNCILQVVVSIVLIITVMPLLIIFILPILAIYYFIQRDYRSAAREAKRFDSIARSPRYAHFKETLQGLTVIRSFSKEKWFIENFYEKLKFSQQMFYSHYMLNRWFSSRIPLIGGLITGATAIGITLSVKSNLMTEGMAGLVTLYSLSFWGYLNWGIRVFADIESRMTSIERLKFFSELPSEQSTIHNEVADLDHEWPKQGEIIVENISVRYADHLPLILKNVSCHIKAQTKVGIIGKTGSGKSTFFKALFRFIELTEGRILIDGINIAHIPLEKLRKSLAIIPQDPTLFMGTVRKNLDRYNQFSDDDIWSALELTGLSNFVNSLPLKLSTEINEGGNNFSQGERQLFCLARALLLKTKIIVMDEATASVDVQTDLLIQKIIREELNHATLIIIAHRLGSLKDCDQVIKLDQGRIAD